MALAWNTGLNPISTAEAIGDWVGFRHNGGGAPSYVVNAEVFIQGSNSISDKVTGANRDEGAWWDLTTTTPGATVDFTTDANRHVMIWVKFDSISFLDTLVNGGIFIIAGSSTANWSKWYMSGSDVYQGGWLRLILDLNKKPSETAGTPCDITVVQFIGAGIKMNGTVTGADNFFIDRADYGQPELQAYADAAGNVDVDWQAYYDEDNNSSNKYGIIQKLGNVFFLLGGVTAGLATQSGTTTFVDETGAVVEFSNPTYYNGDAIVSSIDAGTIYKLSAEAAAAQGTTFTLGKVVGAGDDRQGINGGVIQSAGPRFTIDMETDIGDLTAVNFYGATIKGAGNCQFSDSGKTDIIGSSFVGCDEVQPNAAEFLNNFIVASSPDRGVELTNATNFKQNKFVAGETADQRFERVWQIDVSLTPDGFVEFTDEAASAAAGDVTCFPATEGAGDLFVLGAKFKFSKVRIDTGTARSGGSLLIRYWNGSAWSTLTVLTDGTNTLSTTGLQDITFDPPTDWAATSLNGETPQFYMGFEVVTVMTTNPIVDEAFVSDQVEHALHIPAAGTFAIASLDFFGFGAAGGPKWHGENSVAATLEDSYAFSNQDATEQVGNATITGIGQSITGAAGVLSAVVVELTKVLSPTGNIQCHVYAHSGAFGTTSVPTGGALASSKTIDVTTIPASATEIKFEFDDEFTLVAATNYVFAIEYSGGDASNHILVGIDTSAPSHGGNKSENAGGWTAQSGEDVVFLVIADGLVALNATGGNPTEAEFENTGTQVGTTDVNISVTVTMEALDGAGDGIQDVQCSMYLDSDLSEVLNADSNPSGIATTAFTGSTPAAIHWRMRKGSGGGSNFKKSSGIGTIESGTGFKVTQVLEPNPINQT